jgi:O-antigen/teichoic acid export membrane protein
LLLVIFARPIIGAWLGPAFVDKSSVPLQLLAVGVFINCFAHVPYCFLQALGRPDSTAKLFVCELVPYALLAWLLIDRYGIAGAAAAWSLRAAIEVLLLLWIARRVFSLSPLQPVDGRMWIAVIAIGAAGGAAYVTNIFLRESILADAAVCAIWIAGFILTVWKWVLDDTERSWVMALAGLIRSSAGDSLRSAEVD